jgi:hypothetical protein
MAFFRLMTLGFGAGAFGACILVLVAFVLSRFGLPERLGVSMPQRELPAALYQTVVWGGIWGFLLVLPVLNRLAWLKGVIVGILATAALVLYFRPEIGRGPAILLGYIVVLNVIWGAAAGLWWALVAGNRKNGRKYGSFMR